MLHVYNFINDCIDKDDEENRKCNDDLIDKKG